jgi:hypothetical protein
MIDQLSERHMLQAQLLLVLVELAAQPIRFPLGSGFGFELLRASDHVLVLASLAVYLLAPAEHPHRSGRPFFLAEHTRVVTDRLAPIVTQ